METKNYTYIVRELPESEIEIKGEITWDAFHAFEQAALSALLATIELPGFRKGQVPPEIGKKELADDLILGEMADRAMQMYYLSLREDLAQKGHDVIGRPNVSITKLARGNALGFTLVAAVVPKITLPDYKGEAKKVPLPPEVAVKEEEVEKVVRELQELRAYGHTHGEGEQHAHTEPLPEVTDAFVQSFGPFTSVEAFREKIKENLLREKTREEQDKRRLLILEKVLQSTPFSVPGVLITSEQEKMLAQIESEISRAGMTLSDYLSKTGKTKEAILLEYKPEAEKRARMQLLIHAIAKDTKLTPSSEELDAETKHLLETYPGADQERSRAYADMLLTNEKVLKMLEEVK